MPALQHFLSAEIPKRNWSMEEFARRAQLSLSNAYLIVRDGKDNVRRQTFDNIAAALGMTPAELDTAIGKGPVTADPKRVPIHAILREVPEEDLGQVDRVIRTFVRLAASGRRDAASKRGKARQVELERDRQPRGATGSDDPLALHYGHPWHAAVGALGHLAPASA